MAKWTLSGYEFDALICIQTCDFQSTVHRRQRPRRVTLGGDLPARPQRAVRRHRSTERSHRTQLRSSCGGRASRVRAPRKARTCAVRVRNTARCGFVTKRYCAAISCNALPHQTIHLLQGVPCVQNLIPRRVQVGRRWSLAALKSRLCREVARTGARRRVRA